MKPTDLIAFLGILERMKCNTRHAWTSTGRHETVAAHSWRLVVMAYLLQDEFPDVDMDKVMRMCLVHDFGEAVTGDIPAFLKSDDDERTEEQAVDVLLGKLPGGRRDELVLLFAEMNALQTTEAKLYKALDKIEAILQHNESPLDTWLPLEYELQKTYCWDEVEPFPFLKALRVQLLEDTERKIKDE